jgi:hypothetical protein
MRKVLLALALVLTLVLTGCGPYIDEVNAAHKSRIEVKLEQARAVGKALASQAVLIDDRLPLPKAVLGYGWPAEKPSNAAFIYAEDFASLDQLGWVYARAQSAGLVQRCSSLLHTEREPWDPRRPATAPGPGFGFEAQKLFDACEKLEYLFVIRTRAFARPSEGRRQSPSAPAASGADTGSDAGAPDAGSIDAGADAAASTVPVAGSPTGSKNNDYEFDGGYLDCAGVRGPSGGG